MRKINREIIIALAAIAISLVIPIHRSLSTALALQDAAGSNSGTASTPAGNATTDPPTTPKIRFNFSGVTLDQAIEFFSRETGLSVVREVDVPQAVLTYRTPDGEEYEMEEALSILNTILQTQGVMLYVNKDMLYLQSLTEMVKKTLPIYEGELAERITNDQIVLNVIPLQNALAKPLAEKLATMIGSYGSVTSMDAQNSIIIVETAGKIRQLMQMINLLDREDPQGIIEIFKIRYAKASEIMVPLKALLAERVQKIIINPQNKKQQVIEEQEIRGLNITHDDRSNSIVAKGMQTKIDELREAILLLDVPALGQERMIKTFALLVMTPGEAIQKLNLLYNKLPAPERPTMLPQDDVGKLTIIGSEASIAEGAMLLREIDGGSTDDTTTPRIIERIIAVQPLEHADPRAVASTIQSLLNKRQASMTKIIPGQDQKSLIISGLKADVAVVQQLIPILDTPRKINRDVRMIQLAAADPQITLSKAQALYDKQIDADDPNYEISIEFDEASKTATMFGSSAALDQFSNSLRMVESNTVIERERRQLQIANTTPSSIVKPLQSMARQLLQKTDGTKYVEPVFDPVDQLEILLITATPDQFGIIENLIATLDKEQPGDYQFKVVSLTGVADVDALQTKSKFVFDRLVRGYEAGEYTLPEIEFDPLTGNLMLTGKSSWITMYERAIAEARRLLPPAREGRMIDIQYRDAADVVEPLLELLTATTPPVFGRQIPPPDIKVIEKTNSLFIVAENTQHTVITRYIRDLDTLEPKDLPPLRLLQVRAADATQIATMLRKRYDTRPQEQRREEPVTIEADAATNTLIITTPDDLYDEIRSFVESLGDPDALEPDRETRLFPLKLARANDLERAMTKLYPEPPMPLDRRGRPLPHLREPREVFVSSDASTNTLIVEAPAERMPAFEKLVEQLDRVKLPPQAELRTYRVDRGNLPRIVDTLNKLKERLVEIPEDGSTPVQVMIDSEPESRTLIVAGDEVTFAKVEKLLEDLGNVAVPRDLRIIEVLRADPRVLADSALESYKAITKDDPDATEIEIEIDADNGTLLVVAEPQAMIRFVGIINQLQNAIGPPPDVRLVGLQYAKPSDVVVFLEDLATNEIVRFGEGAGVKPTYFAMDRLNAVLVSARPEQHPIIKSVVESLDKQEAQEMPPLRILQMRSADAANFANALMAQYNQRPADEKRLKPVRITADPNTNALMVAAHPDLLDEIQEIVNDLNDINLIDTEGREIRIFPLKIARAEELARVMDEMYPEPEPLFDRRGRPIPGSRPKREVVVRGDSQTNSLIVDAPIQRMVGFEKLVEQLDRQKLDTETEIHTYQIIHADLNAIATSLKNLISGGNLKGVSENRSAVSVTTEPVSQTLVVAGPSEMFDQVEQLLEALDIKRGPSTSLKFFKLTSARVDNVAPLLREILIARLNEEVPDAGANSEALLNVTTDRKTNMLIISAPDAIMPIAEQLIEQLDTSGIGALQDPIVRVRPLNFATADEVTTNLTQALPSLISKITGDPVDVRLIPSRSSNAIILVGLETDLPQVEELIGDLDKEQDVDAMEAESITLKYANAVTIAPILTKLLTNQQKTDPRMIQAQIRRRRGEIDLTPQIQVEADARTNSLIVSGTQKTVELARKLVEKLDQPDEMSDRIFTTFTPMNGDATVLITTVKKVIESTRTSTRRTTLELIPEPSSGAIVVIGQQEETDQAMKLLAEWDSTALRPPQVDLKIVTLKNSDATVVAQALTPMLRDESTWPESMRKLVDMGISVSQPTVTADKASNRLLISAPMELLPVADQLVAELDAARDDDAVLDLRIFKLTSAIADEVAQALQNAMTARAATRPGEPKPSITAETSSNSIIVSATGSQLQEMEAVITTLDEGVPVNQSQVRTIFLENARAENIAPIVEELLAEEEVDTQGMPSWLQRQIKMEQFSAKQRQGNAMPEIRVAADARLNAVVISASLAVLNVAEQLVEQLDIDPREDPASRRSVRVLTIANADATELAVNLEAIFSEGDQTDSPPTIRVDMASNSLLVRATTEQFESIEQIVQQVDKATISMRSEFSTITIDPSKASARELADTLKRMLDRSGSSRVEVISAEELIRRRKGNGQSSRNDDAEDSGDSGDSGDSVSFLPGKLQDAIIVSLFAVVDTEDGEEENPGDVKAENKVESAKTKLQQAIDDTADVTIAVDEATNSLIVIGSPRAVERIRALAEQIQDRIPAMPGTVRYVGLPESTDARTVVTLINQTLRQLTPVGGKRGDYQSRVTVLADQTNNAIIIAANDVDFETVADLLVALSEPPSTDRVVVKVYPLESITADRAAESVRQLVGDQTGGRPTRGRQTQRARRNIELQLRADGKTIDAVFDPSTIKVSSDAHTNSLFVMASEDAINFIDQFIEFIDQSSVKMQASLRLFPLKYAQASDLSRPVESILRVRYDALDSTIKRTTLRPSVTVDDRTNTLLVTAVPEEMGMVEELLNQLDVESGEEQYELRIVEVHHMVPSTLQKILDQVVIGNDQELRKSTAIVPIDEMGRLLVRAPEDVNAEIDRVLAEIDRDTTKEFLPRTITLKRANAMAVAKSLQGFYDALSNMGVQPGPRGRRGAAKSRRVSVIGDELTNTIIIAASDEDFEDIKELVAKIDSEDATKKLQFEVYPLKFAKAIDIQQKVQELVNSLTWGQGPIFFDPRGGFQGSGGAQGTLAVTADQRLNALIVTGEGDKFEMVQKIISTLDAPIPEGATRLVKLYRIKNLDLDTVSDIVKTSVTGEEQSSRNRRWWQPTDPSEITIFEDEKTRTLIVSATAAEHEIVKELITTLDSYDSPEQTITVLNVENVQPSAISRTMTNFLEAHAQATNSPEPTSAIIASDNASTLIVSANDTDLAMIRDLLTRLDQPISDNRVVELVALKKADPEDVARIIKSQYGSKSGQGIKVDTDMRTNSLVINAPKQTYAAAMEMIALLDSPPPGVEMIIRTYQLQDAQASEVVGLLTDILELDAKGETSGIAVNLEELGDDPVVPEGKVIADKRSNSIVIRSIPESIEVFETLIKRFDEAEVQIPVEWRIIKLEHAMVYDVAFTLRKFLRNMGDDLPEPEIDYNEPENQLFVSATPDQFKQIDELLKEIDLPKESPEVRFVQLEFAEAEAIQEALSLFYGPFAPYAKTPDQLNTRIMANPPTNSLLISTSDSEWDEIQTKIAMFDNEEYDPSLQIRIIPLKYADAQSVAQAINDVFEGEINRDQRRDNNRQQDRNQQGGNDEQRRDQNQPSIVIQTEEWVRASAEPMTNTVLVSASRKNLEKIEAIVAEIDNSDFTKGPAPRLIPVRMSSPEQFAQTLNEVYQQSQGGRNRQGRKSVVIVGSEAANAIVVRAEEEEFQQIEMLAEALQQQASLEGLNVHVLKLKDAPAARIESAIREAFAAKAEETNQPLSITSDSSANSLIIASTAALFSEIEATVKQLDALQPAAGQGIFIIELENLDPDTAKSIIETIGLDKKQDPDSVSRLVTEPIKISTLKGRNAIIVIANPIDRDTIVGIIKAIDADSEFAETEMRIVQLKNAEAGAVNDVLTQMLQTSDQQSTNPLAEAVQEQVRRLAIHSNGVNGPDISLDLTKPIRVIVNDTSNSIIVGSTPENVAALESVIHSLDKLPITDAVVVQMFPLEYINAEDFQRIVRDLFDQGGKLGTTPLTDIQGIPPTEAGKALVQEVAISIDERTNTVIVAGSEEAIAFIEVMKMRLDSEQMIGWIEPRIFTLKYADASDIAELINSILIEGSDDLPQSTPLQDQIGRIRIAQGRQLESDVFMPMTRLVVKPHKQLNALVVVGSKPNLDAIQELITLFDIPEAHPGASIRIYPVKHASASRLQNTISRLFQQQAGNDIIRDEDRVIIQSDERTNALIVSTSPRSFAVVEALLKTLDSEVAPELASIRSIKIENASAATIARTIQELMDARLDRLQEVEPETAYLEKVAIVADARTNNLLVAAENGPFEIIKRLAKELDLATELAGGGIRVLTLTRTTVDRIAETLKQIFERKYADMPPEIRNSQQPLILTDPRTNSLLIAANAGDYKDIEEMVNTIEATPINPAVDIVVLPLDRLRADDLAPDLQRMMQERIETLGDARTDTDKVSIEAHIPSNSLIVAASAEHLQVIKGLIEVLAMAEAETDSGVIEIISLVRNRASDLVDTVDELYVQVENKRRGEDIIRITPNDRLNALIVNAPQADVDAIKNIVAGLEQKGGEVIEIKSLPLKASDPLEIVGLLEEILRGPGTTGRRNAQKSDIFKLIIPSTDDGDGVIEEVEISMAVRESITLTPDRRTNSVIVGAPRESMQLIEKLVTNWDQTSEQNKTLRVFTLKNADAEAMAAILTDLFQTPNREVLTPVQGSAEPQFNDGIDDQGLPDFGRTELTTVPDERKQLSITVDSRTNTLIVAGTPWYLDLVEEVVMSLDTQEANQRIQFVYPLKNAVAEEVARVVDEFVEEDQRKLIETLPPDQLGSAIGLLERAVTIVGDEKSNTLLVAASPRYIDQVKDMIAQLDVDPPQVLIQVLLAEITIDGGNEWGIDFDITRREGDVDLGAGFGLASAFLSGLGVPNLSVAGTDFELLIRALKSQGRLQVLSNPSIMAANNEPAFIQIGETIRVPTNTQITDNGAVNSSVEEQELGVILNVTPNINPDGFVRMSINPEISNLSARTTQISESFSSPVITVRKADTVVTVMDGQTIVLGGLISDRFEIREEAVPLLSDLPILGALFRSTSEQRAKTELLIVLTPHVISTPSEVLRSNHNTVETITADEIDRLSIPEIVKEQIRRGALEGTGGLFDAKGNLLIEPLGKNSDKDKSDKKEKTDVPR